MLRRVKWIKSSLVENVIALEPNHFEAHLLLGMCLGTLQRAPEAVQAFTRAVELNPNSPHGHYNLGVILKSMGQLPQAAHHFETALRLHPGYDKAAKALAALRAAAAPTAPGVEVGPRGGVAPSPVPGPTVPPAAAHPEEVRCPSCGALLFAGAAECSLCGKSLRAAPESRVGPAPPAPHEQVAAEAVELTTGERVVASLWVGAMNGILCLLIWHLMDRFLFREAAAVAMPWLVVLLSVLIKGTIIGSLTGVAVAIAPGVWVGIGAGAAAVVLMNIATVVMAGGLGALRQILGGGIFSLLLVRGIFPGAIIGWIAGPAVMKHLDKAALKKAEKPGTGQGKKGPLPQTGRPETVVPKKASSRAWIAVVVGALVVIVVTVGLVRKRRGGIVWRNDVYASQIAFSPDGAFLAAAAGPTSAGVRVDVSAVRLLRTLDGKELRVLGTKGEALFRFALSPDGKLVATVGLAEVPRVGVAVKLWRVADGTLVAMLPQGAGRHPLAFSPDGKLLALTVHDTRTAPDVGVQLWKVPDLELVSTIAQPKMITAFGRLQPVHVLSVAFSPDGKLMASGDAQGVLKISRISDGVVMHALQTKNKILVVAFSPDGSLVAYGGARVDYRHDMGDATATLCSVSDGKEIRALTGRMRTGGGREVNGLAFSPDGNLLAAAVSGHGEIARIELFRVSDGKLLLTENPRIIARAQTPHGPVPTAHVSSVAFSPDGKFLAWCGPGGVVVRRAPK